MTTGAVPTPPRRAQLLRYSLWQGKDFALSVALLSLILFGLIGTVTLLGIREATSRANMTPKLLLGFKTRTFMEPWDMFALVGPLLAVTGIVSADRAGGFTRFLFSKPLSPRRYYAQAFIVRAVGFLVVGHVLVFAYNYFEPPAYTIKFLADMSLAFIAIGGIAFLCSVLARFDGIIVIVFLFLADIFWTRWESLSGVKKAITYLFPPMNHFTAIHDWMLGVQSFSGDLSTVPFPEKWALWNAGYGLACLLLGLFLLRRMPLTKS